jgi:hypothetical protein
MVTLTPLSKGLIGLAVIGAVASAIWHLALKDTVSEWTGTPPATTESVAPPPAAPSAPPAAVVVPTPEPPPAAPPVIEPPKTPPSSSPAVEPPSAPPAVEPPAVSPKAEPVKTEPESRLSPAESSEKGRKLMDSGNYDDARLYLEQAVKGGDGAAACLLGELHLKGLGGLEASHDKAASLFQIAQSKNIICFASGR